MHIKAIHQQSEPCGGCQKNGTTNVIATASATPAQKKLVMALSQRAAKWVNTLHVAIKIAAHNGIKALLTKANEPGCTITKTLANPQPTASHRRQPTFLPKNGTDSAITIRG